MKKSSFDLMLQFLKKPESVTRNSQDDSIKIVEKNLKPVSTKKIKYK